MKSASGMTLIEVMVALTILSFGIVILSTAASDSSKSLIQMRGAMARDSVRDELLRTARDSEALTLSLSRLTSSDLLRCFDLNEGTQCVDDLSSPMKLYNRKGNDLTGLPGQAIRYNIDGSACQNSMTSAKCPIFAEVTIRAMCPGVATTCGEADAIGLRIRLSQDLSSLLPQMNIETSIVLTRPERAFGPQSGLSGLVASNCPAGHAATGFNPASGLICTSFAMLSGGVNASSCPNGKVANGFDRSGTMTCIDLPSQGTASTTCDNGLGSIEYSVTSAGSTSSRVVRTDAPASDARVECQNQFQNLCANSSSCTRFQCGFTATMETNRAPLPRPYCSVVHVLWTR